MTFLQFIIKSFNHYFRANLLLFFGVATGTAVLTGSLIIGDSVKFSLQMSAVSRLGNTTHAVTSFDRFMRTELGEEMETLKPEIKVSPVLSLSGTAIAEGGARRINKVQIVGVDKNFEKISGSVIFSELNDDTIIVSSNLADKLSITPGDRIMVRIKKASMVPLNAPFVSDAETSVSISAVVEAIAGIQDLGRFNLKISQTAPYNIFISLDKLNELMDFSGKSNQLLISAGGNSDKEIEDVFRSSFSSSDAGLLVNVSESTGEVNITSERVFLDPVITDSFKKINHSHPVLTYFVNSFQLGQNETPYSFVSSVTDGPSGNDIWINEWLADDLKARIGDTIGLSYFKIGPLRELVVKENLFRVGLIVPLAGRWADPDLMPFIPGLSDAGHCREWETGIPIQLGKIRDKDEEYWNNWKGTPKAFISDSLAMAIWSNRFGDYTAVRIPENEFNRGEFELFFKKEISPENLGFLVSPVEEQALIAASNGTDFSQLFLGLSFFVLIASLMLTSLLYYLNLENRSSQMGTLAVFGFSRRKIIRIFLFEGFLSNLTGGIIGILLAVGYTQLIFGALNTLWSDIVRTEILLIKIQPVTLIAGFLISTIFSMLVTWFTIHRFMNRSVVQLQKKVLSGTKLKPAKIKLIICCFSLFIALLILAWQFIFPDRLEPVLFFISGGLLLIGLLIFADTMIIRSRQTTSLSLSSAALSARNISRNRSRSVSIIILFAIGTFLVSSTGSNRRDLFSGAGEKTSGTGGFLFYAETSVPVLFNMNEAERRAMEGMSGDYPVKQFFKIDGDDASCLNLNRISQPAILGIDPADLKGRFAFASVIPGMAKDEGWNTLGVQNDDGTVNAIADQTVIQWGLGKKVGDTLFYRNETGDTLRLRLTGGLEASIFQGNVIISKENFLKNFPTSSGSTVFLVGGEKEQEEPIGSELQTTFRDFGWEMQPAAQRLAEFNSVSNTYLSIFMALGALGLIIGTLGLTVILARTILERKKELALFLAVGFRKSAMVKMVVQEYGLLLLTGLLIGIVSAIVSTLPALISPRSGASFSTILILAAIILANGWLWIYFLTKFSIRQRNLVPALRNE